MSLLKKIAGETAIYGLPTIVGRALNVLLVPLYTAVMPENDYGIVSELYATVAFLLVLMVYRFETAFFRFGSEKGGIEKTFSTAMTSLIISTILIGLLLIVLVPYGATKMDYRPDQFIYFYLFIGILCIDVLAEIPLARLRLEGKAFRFATVRMINIGINISLNLFFLLLCPWLLNQALPDSIRSFIDLIYNDQFKIGYIFISNAAASAVTILLLTPQLRAVKWHIDRVLWSKMFRYAAPLVIVGFAGIVNEMLDRTLLKQLLPFESQIEREAQLGIYSGCYKIAMLLALFTQAFRYAAEPFFFKHAGKAKSPQLYATIGKYFFIAGLIGFLGIVFYLDYIQELLLRRPAYKEGLHIVPILLLANLALGLYYNFSVWYKLTDRTRYAMFIAIGGAMITIGLNIYWIPRIGFDGSAWATLICYSAMTAASYFIGRRYFSLPYDFGKMGFYLILALALYFVSTIMLVQLDWHFLVLDGIHLIMLVAFVGLVFMSERTELRKWLKMV